MDTSNRCFVGDREPINPIGPDTVKVLPEDEQIRLAVAVGLEFFERSAVILFAALGTSHDVWCIRCLLGDFLEQKFVSINKFVLSVSHEFLTLFLKSHGHSEGEICDDDHL